MSWGYWGIVGGLVAMVATFFVCLGLLYSTAKGSPKAPSGKIDEPKEAVTHASAGRRRAA
jgi:archaellum component FlaF (FlaF/FlaG flagellin family)